MTRLCAWLTGTTLLALGAWAVTSMTGTAADKKDASPDIIKLAGMIAKGGDGAAKEAEAIAKKYDDLDKVMKLFKARKRKGLGVGKKDEKITPDGIELKLLELADKQLKDGKLSKEASALAAMGYHVAAIAEVAKIKVPEKGSKADWEGWSEDLKKAAVDLAKAAKAKDAKGISAAANRMNTACAKCHEVHRKNN